MLTPSHPYYGLSLLALDYGTKHMGLAHLRVGTDPFPLLLPPVGAGEALGEIEDIIDRESIQRIVLGLPLRLNGTPSPMTNRVRRFGEKIKIPLSFQDEALSSQEAKEMMESSPKFNFKFCPRRVHSVAASIILQDFLFSSSPPGQGNCP